MSSLQQTRRRRVLAVVAAAALTTAYVQVASVPTAATARPTPYTWDSAFREVRDDVSATVVGIRRERDEIRAILTKMRYDLRVLDQTLANPGATRSG